MGDPGAIETTRQKAWMNCGCQVPWVLHIALCEPPVGSGFHFLTELLLVTVIQEAIPEFVYKSKIHQ